MIDKKQSRRQFIKTLGKAAISATGAVLAGPVLPRIGPVLASVDTTDIFVVNGRNHRALVREGIKQLGGIERFVKKGDSVVIKPNAAWSRTPEQAANTNPEVVSEVVRICREAGAGRVEVVEHTCDNYRSSFRISGIQEAVEKAGARMFSLSETQGFTDVRIPEGKTLNNSEVSSQILSADCFINIPVAKSHGSARLTMAMKNHMGAIRDRLYFHRTDLDQCIADISSFLRPDITILDQTRIMTAKGPKGPGPVKVLDRIVVGTDQVAIDTYGTTTFGLRPEDIGYLMSAREMKIGITDFDRINIKDVVAA